MVFNVILRYQNRTEGKFSYQIGIYWLLVVMVVAEVRTSSKSSSCCSSTSSTSSRKNSDLMSAAVRLLWLWVWIPPGARAWIFVSCECCVLSGRDLCVGLTTHPVESYRFRCVWVWSRSFENVEALAH